MLSDPTFWLIVGFTGQALFTARFVVQWIASEKKRDSVVPVAFWWFSLMGGGTLLSYAIYRRDPVIIVGQFMGLFIYTRNLMLVAKARRIADRRRDHAKVEHPAESGDTLATVSVSASIPPPHIQTQRTEAHQQASTTAKGRLAE